MLKLKLCYTKMKVYISKNNDRRLLISVCPNPIHVLFMCFTFILSMMFKDAESPG